jgi:O-antigen ligase
MALNAYLVIKEQYWGYLLPVVLLLLLLYIYSLDKILLIITFATPLAVVFRDDIYGVGVSLPTEPLLLGVLLIFTLRQLYINDFDTKVWKHPLSLAVIFNLLWIMITSVTSEFPMVSLKFLLARLWFVIPFYFVISQLFKEIRNVRIFIWLYTVPLIGVIGFTLYQHSLWGFAEEPGHWVMTPFYNDHTAYGAVLAMYIPILLGLAFNRNYTRTSRLFSVLAFVILMVAIFFSYTRAAWLSLAAAFGLFVLVYFKVKLRVVLIGFATIIGLFFAFQTQIFQKMEKNKQDSSSDIVEHIQSMSNISSDASNLERINRWNSAFRMFHERPVVGWGPGTYQFIYAPFQNSKERTIISTNAGDKGNAHSEYIGPMAESGILGLLSFLLIAVMSIFYGLRVYQRAADREVRLLGLLLVLGLFTYFIHGFLNNFLDTDKASIPFWGFCAAILALDLYQARSEKYLHPDKTNS